MIITMPWIHSFINEQYQLDKFDQIYERSYNPIIAKVCAKLRD